MKKLLIASAALAMVAGTVQAQSSVSVYGVMDVNAGSVEYTNLAGSTGLANSRKVSGLGVASAGAGGLAANRLGFRGTEDLGGGLKAGFNYELAFNTSATGADAAATNTNISGTTSYNAAASNATSAAGGGAGLVTAAARISELTLSSANLGTVAAGYNTTAIHGVLVGHRALGGTNLVGDLSYSSDSHSSADNRIHTGIVRNNAVRYTTPVMAGFQARFEMSNDRNRDGDNDPDVASKGTGFSVTYNGIKNTSIAVGSQENLERTTSSVGTKTKVDAVSGAYTLGAFKFDALYAKRETTTNATGLQASQSDVKQVGVRYTVSPAIALTAQYGTGHSETTPGATDKDLTGTQIGALYSLSKRTTAYAVYGKLTATYEDSSNVKETAKQMIIGLNHSF